MAGRANAEKLWGASAGGKPPPPGRGGRHLGEALLAMSAPDLFGFPPDPEAAERLGALRRRRRRARRRTAAEALLAEPWTIADGVAAADAVALARRFLRRYPDRDRADPSPPLLTARQEAAEWHAEEAIAEPDFHREVW